MKKITVLILFIAILLFLSACSYKETSKNKENIVEENYKEFLHCEMCDDSVEDKSYIKTDNDEMLCVLCAFENGYIKCKGCDSYFKSDIALDATAYYCSGCAYDNASGCHLCGSGPLDFDKLVEFVVDNESCYMCVDCCADYFSNIEQMKPCYYCIICGNIFDGKYYRHYIYDETICANCVNEKGFKECQICKKHFNEGKDSVCGYCIEKGEEL